MEPNHSKQANLLSSVKNALRILHSFSVEEPEKGIRELAKTMGLGKSTVQRLMSTLASEGFVTKDPVTNRYRLGVSVLSLSTIVTSHLEIHKESLPLLQQLVARVGETAHIGVLEGTDIIYLHKEECKHPIRIFTYIGRHNPAHCTGIGKAILAFQKDEVINRVIENGLTRYTNGTITDPDGFYAHLQEIKKQGYAINMEELGEGIVSIAAPVRDYTGHVVAAVNIVGPLQRIKRSNISSYAREVIRVGKEISERLGYWK